MKPWTGNSWAIWWRLGGLTVTALLVWVVFRRVDFAALAGVVRRVQPGWVLLGLGAYGAALVLGAFRSHVALRATDCAVHFLASCRVFLVAHFLFVALFGVVGGDPARAAIYARWYRFGLPEVLAAAPLDRALSLGGTILLGLIVALLAVATGGGKHWREFQAPPAEWWVLGAVFVTGLALGLVFWKPAGNSFVARTWRAFRLGAGRWMASPGLAGPGVVWGLLSQAALSAVVALNLRAVTDAPLPWVAMAWTFPAITVISFAPFTVAGVGAREVAAITLLGLYGVTPAEGVAAAWLTLAQKLALAGLGAVVLWREDFRLARRAGRPLPRTVSVVIPALNEAAALPETLRRLQAVPEVTETIVVDGGSVDGTRALAEQFGCRVLSGPPGRGRQMRVGAEQARGDVVLLLHADTWVPPGAGRAMLNCLRDDAVAGGGFWKRFHRTPVLLLGSRARCAVRLLLGRRIMGDQGIFVRREVLERIGGVPDLPLMEEFELCRRLRRVGRLTLADATVVTSARRYRTHGVLRLTFRMWRVTWLYRLGKPPAELARLYDRP